MARHFTAASTEKIDLSLGAGASLTGAVTLAAIIRTSSDGTNSPILAIGSLNTTQRLLTINPSNVLQFRSAAANRQGTTTVLAADGWALVAVTKAAGTATPRFHIYKYATNTWVHEAGSGTAGDSTPSTSSNLGTNTGAAFFDGDIAVAGAWASALSDGQVEALAFDLTAWWQVQPNGLWVLDQSAISQSVTDKSGNGANQTAITGTSIASTNPPRLSYPQEFFAVL